MSVITKKPGFIGNMKRYKALLFMLIPGFLFFLIFNYIPMYGIVIAFKDYKVSKGVFASAWVGLDQFIRLFESKYFLATLKNTLVISLLKLFLGFPAPILFAILLNEIRHVRYKKTIQTISYLPYFISWVVLAGIFNQMFSLDGPVNTLLNSVGLEKRMFLAKPFDFLVMVILTDIYKSFGWGSIIYFAAISNIDNQLYEAAIIDGANRFQRVIRITLPSLVPVITIFLVFSTSGILNAGFDQLFNMMNSNVVSVAEIIDTYVYKLGFQSYDYSFSTAVGLFKSVVAVILIVLTNKIAQKINDENYTLW